MAGWHYRKLLSGQKLRLFYAIRALSRHQPREGTNRYALAGGNPLSFLEWDGHFLLADGGGGSASSPNPSATVLRSTYTAIREGGTYAGNPTPQPTITPQIGPAPPVENAPREPTDSWMVAARWLSRGGEAALSAYAALRERASTLGRVLRTSEDPELVSRAARYLPAAGRLTRLAEGPVFKALGLAGISVSGYFAYRENVEQGQSRPEAVVRAGLEVSGGAAGAYIAGAACGAAAIATAGIGGVVCVGAVVVGGVAGGWIGHRFGQVFFEDVPRAYEATKHALGRAVDVLSFWN